MTSYVTNTQYKDRLFRLLFGNMEMKENIISLYNAINGTDYQNEEEFQITTLEDVIYIKMKNDVSLLIDSYLPLWEQQSSYNPNMPLRGLMYFGGLYSAYIEEYELNIYGSSLVKIPTPQYIVFYVGLSDCEPITKLRLSDAFIHKVDGNEFEWTATMYNLNQGKNEELLSRCKPLKDYMTLINYIRYNQQLGKSITDAVDDAVVRCIEEDVLSDFLRTHRAEVMDVCLTEFNEKVFVKGIREEGFEEGIEEGREEGFEEGREETRFEILRAMITKHVSKEQALEYGFTEEEYDDVMDELCVATNHS